MRVISLKTIREFYEQHDYADSKEPLLTWYRHALNATWPTPADIKADFGTASILKEGRVVFNIHGNKYRLVIWFNYPYGIAYVKFVGTHEQYDAIDAQTI